MYRPQPPRLRAASLTAGIIALPLLGSLIVWQAAPVQVPPATPLAVFDVPAASEPPTPKSLPPARDTPPPAAEPKVVPVADASFVTLAAPIAAVPVAAPAPIAAPAGPKAPPSEPPPSPSTRPAAPTKVGPADWQSRVLGRLNAVKRYPSSARARRQQGVALIRFSVDRAGAVDKVTLARSSGFALLDREALALPRRASPLPPPPEDMLDVAADLVVPVDFTVG